MSPFKSTVLTLGLVLSLTLLVHCDVSAAEFSAEATALPYPPDARELEFVAWAGDINYNSHSPLKSLAAFYLNEMAKRGWQLDDSDLEIDDDSIELNFNHDDVKVKVRLSQWSKEVRVRLDCKKLKFTDTDNPTKLAAVGLPVPQSALFIQQELTLPDSAQDLKYDGDGCMLRSTLKITPAFEHFAKQIKGKGFREARRPIITDTRHYNEFKKGSVEFSINVFEDQVGSRIVLEYENPRGTPAVAPLPRVASLPIKNPTDESDPLVEDLAESPPAKTPINVANNRGQAVITYGGKKYTFANVACYQTKDRGDYATQIIFAAKPMPLNKMQKLIASQDDFSIGDLYEFDFPDYFTLQLGKYVNLSFSADGTGIGGHSMEKTVNNMKIESGRVQGTFQMSPEEILSRQFSFTATIDAAIITPNTRFSSGIADPVERSSNPVLADSPVPMPPGAEDVSRSGSNFRKTYNAVVETPLTDVSAFYRQQLAEQGWQRTDDQSSSEAMQFKNDTMELLVALKRKSNETAIEVVTRETAIAKREGILPKAGKGRLVLANAHNVNVVFTIGKTDYPLKAGRGAKDFKQALNYSIPPGNYKVVIKIPGQQPQTELIKLTEGSTWAVVALPTGGYMPLQLY